MVVPDDEAAPVPGSPDAAAGVEASDAADEIAPEVAARLVDRLSAFYETLDDRERALMSGVVWRSLPPVERVRFSSTAPGFTDLELQLLEELER